MKLPLYKAEEVIAYTEVDDEDFEMLNAKTWRLTGKGYASRSESVDKIERRLYIHRVVIGAPDNLQVDHKDRNKLNNRKSNLRVVTNSVNAHNRGLDGRNTSGATGVHWDSERNMWRAKTSLDNKAVHLGRFKKYDEAVKAIEKFKLELWG